MSRLYLKARTDTRKKTITSQCNTEMEISIYWGSKGNSMPLLEVEVTWERGKDAPNVLVHGSPDKSIRYVFPESSKNKK